MSRWPDQALDTQQITEGDSSFVGFNDKLDRDKLPPQFLAKSQNKRMFDGSPHDRKGLDFPPNFNPGFGAELKGSGIFTEPLSGDQSILAAESGAAFVWNLSPSEGPNQVPVQDAQLIPNTPVYFTQTFDSILLLRPGLEPMVWDGLN